MAPHDVYLECGLWWRELYEQALEDPNVGPGKLLWGTDWGASMEIHSQLGRTPPSYPVQVRSHRLPRHQTDYWGWSLREVSSLRISQDDLKGGNASRLYGLDAPHRRLFAE